MTPQVYESPLTGTGTKWLQVVSSRVEEQRKLFLHGYIRARSVRALLYVEVGFPESVISCNNEWYWKLDSWCILAETIGVHV